MSESIPYCFEVPAGERVRIGYIGCGGHSWRNVFPTFQYAPVELAAVCDLNLERAQVYQRQFGAAKAYDDHRAMLANEHLDACFVVTNYDEQGHPRASALAAEVLRAGCHVWMEKPPAASVAQIEALQAISAETGRFAMVGFKKMFFPAIEKIKAILATEAFGGATSIASRYPQGLPADTSSDRAMLGFLDHIVHPGSILVHLMGPIAGLCYLREPQTGATVTSLRFVSGAVGTLHLTAGQSGTGPLERLEVIGRGEHVVLDNGIRLTYYRKGGRGGYGRAPSFVMPDDQAPLVWEPEFSLGQLYNKNLFLLGYAQEVRHFCECVQTNTPPRKAGLDDALEIMKLYEAYRRPEGTWVTLNPAEGATS